MQTPTFSKDFSQKKIIVEKTFEAPRTKVWQAFTTDSILIQWWGPKEWPAASKSFDFREGGHWHYNMIGPDNTQVWGWIDYKKIVPEESIIAEDCFADAEGNKDLSMPSTKWFMRFRDQGRNTKMTVELSFETAKSMQELIDMDFESGFTDALDNLDKLLPKL